MLNRNQSRIRWQCRRGMLELDILLIGFFDRYYLSLDEDNKILFEELLSNTDQDLYSWLVKNETPPDLGLADLVNKIRNATASTI